jgi:hypothetical protein
MLTPKVTEAVEQIRTNFPENALLAREDGQGGALVRMEALPLGTPYAQSETWVGFRVTFQYPYADVYPHFVRPDLSRLDGRALGEAISPSTFDGQPALQISRRSNHLNPAIDTALMKLLKVLDWLRRRP